MLILNIIILILILVLGFNFKNNFKIFNKYDRSILDKLFVYHLLFSFIFHFIISSQGGDSTNYWFLTYDFRFYDFKDVIEMASKGSATGNMLLINYFPAKILEVSFFTGNILYGSLGYIGFVFFYAFVKEMIPKENLLQKAKIFRVSLFPYLFFLPNLHFWSAGISKDTLLFFCIALFIYSLKNLKNRFLGIILSFIISMSIRPHIMLFLIFAFGVANVLDGRLKSYQKGIIFILFLVGFASIFGYVIQFVRLESFDAATIESYTSRKISGLSSGSGSGVDTSSYPYPLKVFTFLFRPLFFDSPNLLGILASIENLILILFTVRIFRNRPLKAFRMATSNIKGVLIFFLIGAAAFPLILGNLGIMLRQKNMFIPLLIIFGYWVINYNMQRKYNRIQ